MIVADYSSVRDMTKIPRRKKPGPRPQFSKKQALSIRGKYNADRSLTMDDLGKRYQTDKATISRIVNSKPPYDY